MVLRFIKSTWLSNFTSQAKTNLMTFINTMVEQRQGWVPLLKDGIGIFFTNFLNFIMIGMLLITLLAILLPILIYGLVTLSVDLVMRTLNYGKRR
jgi:hypothetical protein